MSRFFCVCLLTVCASLSASSQQLTAGSNAIVPPLVNFRGVLADENGKALTDLVGVTFSLYRESQGGSPLWLETQNVQPDRTGHYAVQLGSINSLSANLFASTLISGTRMDIRP